MQRCNALDLKHTDECYSLADLAKPEDERQFYTASVQFLKKRLQEKANPPSDRIQNSTQSCCSLNVKSEPIPKPSCKAPHLDSEPIQPSLSMHQVLPFPKSNRESFFTRLKNSFRKLQTSNFATSTKKASSSESSNTMAVSHFKFPQCRKLPEENSKDNPKPGSSTTIIQKRKHEIQETIQEI